jgi:phosphotransferase system enzyme I (PtsI)
VLRLIQSTAEVATRFKVDLAVCGEMASQPLMAFALIGLGLRQLSVAPRSVALIKRLVRGISIEIAGEAASAALRSGTALEAEHALRRRLHAAFGEAPFLEHGLPAPPDDNNIRKS